MAAADPDRDARLDPEYRQAILPFYASSLLGERAAAAYARRAATAGPPELAGGFAAQAGDEERHAALDATRLGLLGVDPESAERLTPGVAREMREALEVTDPLRRMFLTNFIGETALASATFPFVIRLAEANSDALSVALNRARLRDERRHAAFAERTFSILVAQDARNLAVLQRWQDEHFAPSANAFIEEVAPALESAPNRPDGDWLGDALAAYRRRAEGIGLRAP